MNNKRLSKKALVMVLSLIFTISYTLTTFKAEAKTNSDIIGKDELAVVNFMTKWGDKEANINSMIDYIEEAHNKGVKMILFPEMSVTGYASSSEPSSEVYKMAVEEAEYIDGPTAEKIAEIADIYDMWIIYGASEKIEGDDNHAYNSAFACSPEGEVTAYEKITPVEGSWCTPGTTPVILDTEFGKVGLSICYDTYATPELERYYSANGCKIILNPTATSRSYYDTDGDGKANDEGWEWYYKNRLESITSREGILIASSNLVGKDGPVSKESGEGIYDFPGRSVIVSAAFDGPIYFGGAEDSNIITGKDGLITNSSEIDIKNKPSSTTKVSSDFHPDYYALWYKELADRKANGESLSYTSKISDGPIAAVVNCSSKWGDKEANKKMMIKYIEEAASKNVNILVFPETVLTGYSYEDPEKDTLQGNDEMHVALAETIPGETTNELSEYAKKYGMYIIFGMSEKDKKGSMFENAKYLNNTNVEKVYNSAAILFPDGNITSYQKMHRAGLEANWSVCGSNPVMFDSKWGKIGIDICRDGHFYPELGRYYAASGCTILIHPTATTGNPWYRETRIGSYTDRDGMAAITCNLLGPDGIYDENTKSYSGGEFASTSLIITKYINKEGKVSFNPITGSAISLNGTGSESEGYDLRGTSPEGLEVAKMNLTGTGFRINNFNPLLFAEMYDELAKDNIEGYKSIFPGVTLNKAETIDLVSTDSNTYIQAIGKVSKGAKLLVDGINKNDDYTSYNLKLVNNDGELNNLKVRIPLSLIDKKDNFKVYKTDEEGNNIEIPYIIENDYIVFKTDSLGEFKVGDIKEISNTEVSEENKDNIKNGSLDNADNIEKIETTKDREKVEKSGKVEKIAKTGDSNSYIYIYILIVTVSLGICVFSKKKGSIIK
ncbi:Predicted amidohydrolase [Clostridium sp. DSM 8431]|uniref:carbon-nitrogen hydrolase family protein n=1 Tax=Clostridium sp. DSM 8431 TaxID=1761781 RepID=UPI0008F3938A|nr:carbon-nitrogen hydrolase family protein [Clostridium sp. DSM 8431]SFU56256.1 Predicted amidohydrolase [Clostridium sp. DSM 8431]